MNWQKFFITFIVLYIVTSVLGFLIHGLWLSSQYEQLSGVWRGDMDKFMWVQYVTGAFYCFFFVFIFARGQENKGIMEGIRYGLIIWGFYTIPTVYNQFMIYPLPYNLIMEWLFSDLVVVVILGILTAVLYKPKKVK